MSGWFFGRRRSVGVVVVAGRGREAFRGNGSVVRSIVRKRRVRENGVRVLVREG